MYIVLVDIVYVTIAGCHSFSVTNMHTHVQTQYNCRNNAITTLSFAYVKTPNLAVGIQVPQEPKKCNRFDSHFIPQYRTN